jgi:hypothetical protein
MQVDLNCLNAEAELATGDPVFCANCNIILNSTSKLAKKPDSDDEYLWICEFCGATNNPILEQEEIPKSDQITYVIENAQGASQSSANDDTTVIFCLDISGSMCVTKPVSGSM